MSIIKNQLKSQFSQIPNALVIDKDLSHGAKMVAIYLYTKPDNWRVNNADIMENLGIARRETIAGYLKELIDFGWITRIRKSGDNGKFGGFDYSLSTEKCVYHVLENSADSCTEKPYTDHVLKNSTLNNTNLNNNTEDKKNIIKKILTPAKTEYEFEEFWKAYPKRFGSNPKFEAGEKFKSLVRKGESPDDLIKAAKNYAAHVVAAGNEGTGFVQMATTFLNKFKWKDWVNGNDGQGIIGSTGAFALGNRTQSADARDDRSEGAKAQDIALQIIAKRNAARASIEERPAGARRIDVFVEPNLLTSQEIRGESRPN